MTIPRFITKIVMTIPLILLLKIVMTTPNVLLLKLLKLVKTKPSILLLKIMMTSPPISLLKIVMIILYFVTTNSDDYIPFNLLTWFIISYDLLSCYWDVNSAWMTFVLPLAWYVDMHIICVLCLILCFALRSLKYKRLHNSNWHAPSLIQQSTTTSTTVSHYI